MLLLSRAFDNSQDITRLGRIVGFDNRQDFTRLHHRKYGPIPASFWALFKNAILELSEKSFFAALSM